MSSCNYTHDDIESRYSTSHDIESCDNTSCYSTSDDIESRYSTSDDIESRYSTSHDIESGFYSKETHYFNIDIKSHENTYSYISYSKPDNQIKDFVKLFFEMILSFKTMKDGM
jgi:hypothetical protein